MSRERAGFGFGIGFCMEGFENSCGMLSPSCYEHGVHGVRSRWAERKSVQLRAPLVKIVGPYAHGSVASGHLLEAYSRAANSTKHHAFKEAH